MEYGNPAQASAPSGLGTVGTGRAGEGPQLISRLGNQLRGLIELRTHLRGVNRKLRGMQPEPSSNKASEVPKPIELSLCDITREMELLIEQCHSEAGEMSGLLS